MSKTWLTLVVFIAGCTVYPQEDVSGDARFSSELGQSYFLTDDVIAVGLTADPNYRPPITYVKLFVPPGVAGPEVLDRAQVKKGARVTITGVFAVRPPFQERLYYSIEGINCSFCSGVRVLVERGPGGGMPGFFALKAPP